MEVTVFTGWVYDHLKPHTAALKFAHPLMLRAVAAGKKNNDHIDAKKICDCLRCDFLPERYTAPTAIRERRRVAALPLPAGWPVRERGGVHEDAGNTADFTLRAHGNDAWTAVVWSLAPDWSRRTPRVYTGRIWEGHNGHPG